MLVLARLLLSVFSLVSVVSLITVLNDDTLFLLLLPLRIFLVSWLVLSLPLLWLDLRLIWPLLLISRVSFNVLRGVWILEARILLVRVLLRSSVFLSGFFTWRDVLAQDWDSSLGRLRVISIHETAWLADLASILRDNLSLLCLLILLCSRLWLFWHVLIEEQPLLELHQFILLVQTELMVLLILVEFELLVFLYDNLVRLLLFSTLACTVYKGWISSRFGCVHINRSFPL